MTTHTQRGGFMPPNFTAVPNDLIDHFMKNLKGSHLKIVLVICRKTIGWHKQTERISKGDLSVLTGLNIETVDGALKELEHMKIIRVEPNPGYPNSYEIICETASVEGGGKIPPGAPTPPRATPPAAGAAKIPPPVLYMKETNKESVRSGATDAHASLSRYLFEAIKKSDPGHKYNRTRPALLRWADDLRKAMDIDGRIPEEITYVIDYIFTRETEVATFWRPSIQSGESLRANFDIIKGQIKTEKKKSGEEKVFDIAEANRIFMENFSGSNGSGTPFENVFTHWEGDGKEKKFKLNPAYKSHIKKW